MTGYLINDHGWTGQTVPDFDWQRFGAIRLAEPEPEPCSQCGKTARTRFRGHATCNHAGCNVQIFRLTERESNRTVSPDAN